MRWIFFTAVLILVCSPAFAKGKKDRDGDGIPDEIDLCPGEMEILNGMNDEDGCPDTIFIRVRGKVSESAGTVQVISPSGEKFPIPVKDGIFDFVTALPGIYSFIIKKGDGFSRVFPLYLNRGQFLNLPIP